MLVHSTSFTILQVVSMTYTLGFKMLISYRVSCSPTKIMVTRSRLGNCCPNAQASFRPQTSSGFMTMISKPTSFYMVYQGPVGGMLEVMRKFSRLAF